MTVRVKIFLGFLVLAVLSLPFNANAQKVENSFQKDFFDFRNSINQQFDSFVHHNDSVFIQFLADSWKEFKGIENKAPKPPKPVQQPQINNPLQPKAPDLKDTTKIIPDLIIHQFMPEKKDTLPPKVEAMGIVSSSFQFYGAEIAIPRPGDELPVLSSVTKEGIINYFKSAANSELINSLIIKVKRCATTCRLNDWGLTSLLMTAAQKLYSSKNEQVLLTWYALNRNGFNAKVGFNKERVYLLLPVKEKVYYTSYAIKGIDYYLFDFSPTPSDPNLLSIYEADYPGNKSAFSLLLTETPLLGNQNITKSIRPDRPFELKISRDLIDFYNNYPSCELKVFFGAPLSEDITRQLDKYFNPVLKNLNDDEKVAFLLSFVQRCIPYKTDQEQFGREKYLFAEETLYYPAADCEDRSILLAKLINHYTKLETIGLLYPDHVSLAVNIKDMERRKCFTYREKNFYCCDATYLGAQCGEVMPRLMSSVPEIIDYY